MKCAYCGHDNPPGTRLCANCKFILRDVDPASFDRSRPGTPSRAQTSPARRRILSESGSRKSKLILIAVAAVVTLSTLALSQIYTRDSSMLASLYYSYQPPTDTSEGTVHVWGSVYNHGNDEVEAVVDILISDAFGHSCSERLRIGTLDVLESVKVSSYVPWPHACLSAANLDVTYEVLTRSTLLF